MRRYSAATFRPFTMASDICHGSVELVMAMEEEFEIDEIPEEDLLTLKTVGDCVRYLTAKLN